MCACAMAGHTVWLALILALVGLGGIVGVAGWMGNDPTIMAKLDELSAGDQPPLEMLRQFWAIPGSKALVAFMCGSTLLYLVWTLKRTLQGFLSIWQGLVPATLGPVRWLALRLLEGDEILKEKLELPRGDEIAAKIGQTAASVDLDLHLADVRYGFIHEDRKSVV